jgi:hypothetical protein
VALLKFVALWVAVSLLLALALGRALRELGGRALADEVEAYLRRIARPRVRARRSSALTSIITVGMLTLAAGAAAGRHLPPPSIVFGDGANPSSSTRTTTAPADEQRSSAAASEAAQDGTTTTTTVETLGSNDATSTTVPESDRPAGATKERSETATPNGRAEREDHTADDEVAATTTTSTSTTTTSTTLGTPSGTTTTTTTEPPPPTEDPGPGN